MSSPQEKETLLQSQTILVLGQAVHLLLGLVATWALLVHTSAETFGVFILAQSLLTLFGQVIDAGLEPALVASWARNEKDRGGVLQSILKLRRTLARPAAVLAMALFLVIGPDGEWSQRIAASIAICAALWLAPLRTYQSIFVARQRNFALTISRVAIQVIFVSVIGFSVAQHGDNAIWVVVWAIALRHLAVMIVPRLLIGRAGYGVLGDEGQSQPKGLTVLAVASICAALFLHVDVLLLRMMVGLEEVGTYGVGIRLVGPLITVVGLLAAPLMPFFATHTMERSPFGMRQRALLASLCVVGAVWPISFAYMVSGDLLELMPSDTDTGRAALVTVVLGFVAVPLVFRAVGSLALITTGLSRRWLWVSGSALLVNLGLNVMVIPAFGALGAAAATLFTESLAAVGVFCCLPSKGRVAEILKDLRGLALALTAPPLLLSVFWFLEVPNGILRLVVTTVLAIALSVGFSLGPWGARIRQHIA